SPTVRRYFCQLRIFRNMVSIMMGLMALIAGWRRNDFRLADARCALQHFCRSTAISRGTLLFVRAPFAWLIRCFCSPDYRKVKKLIPCRSAGDRTVRPRKAGLRMREIGPVNREVRPMTAVDQDPGNRT